jgi:hypothetical protein
MRQAKGRAGKAVPVHSYCLILSEEDRHRVKLIYGGKKEKSLRKKNNPVVTGKCLPLLKKKKFFFGFFFFFLNFLESIFKVIFFFSFGKKKSFSPLT